MQLVKKMASVMGIVTVTLTAAHAEDAIRAANRQLSLEFERQKLEYHEFDNQGLTSGGWLDSENGSQNRFGLTYTVQGEAFGVRNLYFKSAFTYGEGKTDYDGYLVSSGSLTPFQSKTDVTTSDLDMRLGKGFQAAAERVQLTPLIAYRYHTWKRDLAPGTSYGYREDYSHSALSVGLLGQLAITDSLVASLYGDFGRTLGAQLRVDHAQTLDLKSRNISVLEFGLNYRLATQFQVHGGVRQTRFRYGQSDALAGGTYEPESRTKLTQYFAGAGYSF